MAHSPETVLDQEYASATARARRAFAGEYYLTIISPTSADYPAAEKDWREVWRLEIDLPPGGPHTLPRELLLAIPNTFPDKLPSVYLPRTVAQETGVIPHLDDQRFLCTFDGADAHPNSDDPVGVALRVIERGLDIWTAGVSGANRADYLDEFGAYWALGSTVSTYSLVTPTDEPREVAGLRLVEAWEQAAWLFAEGESDGKRWLVAAGYGGKTEAIPILYLPLNTLGLPPLPSTNGEIYERVRDLNPNALPVLLDFLHKHDRPTGVLFSLPVDGRGRVMGAWWHPEFAHKVYQGHGPALKVSGVMPGFRQSKSKKKAGRKSRRGTIFYTTPKNRFVKQALSNHVELSTLYRAERLKRAVVSRVDPERLFQRTTGMLTTRYNHAVNVIGCGSNGGFAAEALARSGTAQSFRLVEPEHLGVENVPRHYCGMADVGKNKAAATAAKLISHFPHVVCESHESDILELLRARPSALQSSSLTLVAIGDITVERRLNKLSRLGAENGSSSVPLPLCFMWVEPHLYGGHVVYIRDPRQSCFECAFSEQMVFTQRVLSHPERFSKREAGCQTTFVPYSGLDLQQFICATTRFLLAAADSPDNLVFSWVGDIDGARRQGVDIEETWADAAAFSTHTSLLSRNTQCCVCAAESPL